MMGAEQRHGEFVADLSRHGPRLCEADMVGI